jgi:hypothetical protein
MCTASKKFDLCITPEGFVEQRVSREIMRLVIPAMHVI